MFVRTLLAFLPIAVTGMIACPPPLRAASFDVVIRNARIVDGTGAPWFRGEIAINGDTIVAIDRHISGDAARVIDARDQVVAPGFIDLHTHARRGIFETPGADNYIRQGVTTIFEGPDGGSPVPLRDFFARIEATKIGPNIAAFIGQGSVRLRVMGSVNRKATPEEIGRMKELVAEGMRDGAFGMSTGLFYDPGTFTPTEEVIALARV